MESVPRVPVGEFAKYAVRLCLKSLTYAMGNGGFSLFWAEKPSPGVVRGGALSGVGGLWRIETWSFQLFRYQWLSSNEKSKS